VWGGTDGLLFGNPAQLGIQAIGAASSFIYAGVATFVLLKLMGLVLELRAPIRAEGLGMDFTQHGEEAYASAEGSILVLHEAERAVGAPAATVS
jgi:Amt family ammonium transporter